MDRLDPRTPTGPAFPPHCARPRSQRLHVTRDLHVRLPLPGPIHLHVSAETAAERIDPATATLEPIDEHSCTLRAGSNSLDELAIYVTTNGFDFLVHEPPDLVEHIRTLAARLAGATSTAEQAG
ncbi:WYL domain-containing protein [Nocardioides deserti]|uniref:WYL domain-containing protein n=1 Tax=Nocardioides deserti TaxID=1588644 RepID=A0ABR6U690_9ACTN|nr:WYL domain-containing protein [Nocardioides deserti]GGO73659.1 hypothetical protein GCM10012276_19820 [Nocardioides deserti]